MRFVVLVILCANLAIAGWLTPSNKLPEGDPDTLRDMVRNRKFHPVNQETLPFSVPENGDPNDKDFSIDL